MSRHIEGVARGQESLLPSRLEDYVGADLLVRGIDRFVEGLDLAALGFERVRPARTGRPGYAPGDLLKLYLYGYSYGLRSSRRLERECGRNLELMWLLGKLVPDHKTIAMFRRDSGDGLVKVCVAFVQLCRLKGLLNRPEVAIDGSKLQAAAGRRKVLTKKGVKKQQDEVERKIAEYLQELDEADAREEDEPSSEEQRRRVGDLLQEIAKLQKKKVRLQEDADRIERSGQASLVSSEQEARAMRLSDGSSAPAYNMQIAVSTETHLVVHHEITQDRNDRQQLYPMALAAQAAMALEPSGEAAALQVLADSGYSNGEQAAQCEAAGILPCVPPQRAVNTHGKYFDVSKFTYDPQSDTYICPAGQTLTLKQHCSSDKLDKYMAHDCRQCPLKSQCTKSRRRTVSRSWYEGELDRMRRRTADPAVMRRRKCVAEHPFGTMKRGDRARFLLKGIKNARTEAALQVLAYNFRRLGSLLGMPGMIAALA